MAKIINKRNVIGDRFKEAVASLISFTPTTTITGTNVQAALEEVDAHVLASTAISDDEFEETTEIPRDADTLCGVDGNQIISDLSGLKEWKLLGTLTTSTTSLNLPSTVNELLVSTKISTSNIRLPIHWCKEMGECILMGGYYYDTTFNASTCYEISNGTINTNTVASGWWQVKPSVSLNADVYYR